MKRARICVMDNIKVALRRIELRTLDFVQNMERWGEILKFVNEISGSLEMEDFLVCLRKRKLNLCK